MVSKSGHSESGSKTATVFEIDTGDTDNNSSNADSDSIEGLPQVTHMMIRTLLTVRVYVLGYRPHHNLWFKYLLKMLVVMNNQHMSLLAQSSITT